MPHAMKNLLSPALLIVMGVLLAEIVLFMLAGSGRDEAASGFASAASAALPPPPAKRPPAATSLSSASSGEAAGHSPTPSANNQRAAVEPDAAPPDLTLADLSMLARTNLPFLAGLLANAQTAAEKSRICATLVRAGTAESMKAFDDTLLAEKDPGTRAAMLRALEETHDEAAIDGATALISLTNDPQVLAAVYRTIAQQGDAGTVQYLSQMYAAAECVPGQHQNALTALAAVRNPEAVPGQASLLNQAAHPELELASAQSLAKIGTPDAVVSLLDAFHEIPPQDNSGRATLLRQISSVANPQSTQFLQYLVASSTEPLIRAAAGEALAAMPPAPAGLPPAAPVPRW